MYYSAVDNDMTPLRGGIAPLEDIVSVPLLEHEYCEEQDPSFGFWVRCCYTCNKYFGFGGTYAHATFYEASVRKYDFAVKQRERANG